MKIVQFTTDNREQQNDYNNAQPHFGTAPQALLEGFAELPEVEVHVVSCVRREVHNPGKILGNIHYHPVLVPKHGWMSALYTGCIRNTCRHLRDLTPDFVHGQGTERDCAMNAVHSGYPNVVTIHGNMAELNRLGETFQDARLYGFLASRLETHALRRSMGVLCNSAYTESLVAPRSRKIWRIPNAIRKAFFEPAATRPATDVPLIVNVGLVSPRKRQLEILRAAAALHQQGLEFRIIFAGAVPSSDYGKAFSAELNRAENAGYASHAGFLNTSRLIRLMDESHAMIHFPSEEAFGLVVAEAIARGLKFFGSDLGGIRDIAGPLDGTELHDTLENVAHAIGSWLQSGAPRAEHLQPVISELYHPIVVAKQHIEIYKELF